MNKVLVVLIIFASILLFGPPVPAQSNSDTDSGQDQNKIYSNKEVSQQIKLTTRPEPSLTDEARRTGVRGVVVLRAVFTAAGKVENIEVVNGLPAGLTEAAIAATRKIKFEPAQKDGRRVSVRLQLEYNFDGHRELSLPIVPGIHTNLVVDVTKPEDAIRIFGKPKEEGVEHLDVSKLSAWLVGKHKERIFRTLTFKSLNHFAKVRLFFLNEKLMVIELQVKNDLEYPIENLNIYGIEFWPTSENSLDRLRNSSAKQASASKRSAYTLLGISSHSFIYVDCVASNLGLSDAILRIRQVSRTLQNSSGAQQ